MKDEAGPETAQTEGGSTQLSDPNFEGLIERYIPEEPILWSGDADLQTRGLKGDGFPRCAFVLTPTRLWAFRGSGLLGKKKPLSVRLEDVEKVGRLPRLSQPKSYLGINFVAGAQMMRGGAGKQEASLIASWALLFDADAERDSCGIALTAQTKD
jgi:hypothetical protein